MQEQRFTIEYADFKSTIGLGGEWSLYEFAEYINDVIGFDFDHAFEFCDNLKNPYRSKERYSLFADMGEDEGALGVKKTLVSDVFKAKRKLIFHFDYGDDWYFLITCTSSKLSEATRRFRKVIATEGTPPVQYPDEEDE